MIYNRENKQISQKSQLLPPFQYFPLFLINISVFNKKQYKMIKKSILDFDSNIDKRKFNNDVNLTYLLVICLSFISANYNLSR